VGACSGGAVVLWVVPSASASGAYGYTTGKQCGGASTGVGPAAALPVIQLAATGCPQRSVVWAPRHDPKP